VKRLNTERAANIALIFSLVVGLVVAVWIGIATYNGFDDRSAITRAIIGSILGLIVGTCAWVMLFWVLNMPLEMINSDREKREAAQEARIQRAIEARKRQLGPYNDLVESTLTAAQSVARSEAARTGWLGDDFNFDPDIKVIIEKLIKANDLRKTASRLSALDSPTSEDRKLLAEAEATIEQLESVARKRVELIDKCATEAKLIDESLQQERADTKTAEQRAELHAELSSMLYGIKATPDTEPLHSAAADGVLARVQAYREIKNQLQLIRDETSRP